MDPDHPTRRTLRGRAVAGTAAVALAAALVGGGVVAAVDGSGGGSSSTTTVTTAAVTPVSTPTETRAGAATATAVDFSAIYAERRAGVVSITSTVPNPQGSGAPGGSGTAEGSGVVIDRQGHVLTNEHVVDGATSVRVELASGTTVKAKVVGTDQSTDVALLDIDVPASQLDPVPLGHSSTLKVGQPVLAIGDPFGYQGSASAGIVSGLDRSIEAPNGFTINGAIQTDAAVNHGNSGGALLDASGALIGIPAQIADSGVDANVGVAFAVPVDTARKIVEQLSATGSVKHAWLGVSTATVDASLSGVKDIGASSGALITGVVPGGPAAKAGLSGGDHVATADSQPVCVGGPVVITVDGAPVKTAADLQEAVDAAAPGSTITLGLTDPNGSTRTLQVTLGTRPASTSSTQDATCG